MDTLTLTGWGQSADFLGDGFIPLDYQHYPSWEAFTACDIPQTKTVIAWSLGGQVAIRLIAEGRIAPHRLILLAMPLSFDPDQLHSFKEALTDNPQKLLSRFQMLIAKGDTHARKIIRQLKPREDVAYLDYWLSMLGHFDHGLLEKTQCKSIRIIHGENDAVVPVEQAGLLHQALPGSHLTLLPERGHAVYDGWPITDPTAPAA